MSALLYFTVVIGLTANCLVISEGTMMNLSEEFTVYTNQNLTLSCQPRDSPKQLVYWYKSSRSRKGLEVHFYTGPSFTITKATLNDTAFYSCSGAEWGFWGIRRYIMINVIEPGEPSCANGWSLYKNSCFMHSARSVTRTWYQANVYCNESSAQLAKVSGNSDALGFMSDLAKRRNASNVWIGSSRGARPRSPQHQAGSRKCTEFDGRKRAWMKSKCTQEFPFICERVLPEVPKDVTIEHISSSTAHVSWTMAASGNSVTAYYVEMSTSSSGNVVSRKSSSKERSLLLTDLQPNTQYRVRVQAESVAGNGSSSSFVSFNMKENLPIIVTSTQKTEVIAGQSITLQCGKSNQEILWYKDESEEPCARGHAYVIHSASSKDEGTYRCAVDHGPKGSLKVLVIELPVITEVKGILLQQSAKGENKRELLLLCNTANRHPLEYAWNKDGKPLTRGTDTVKVSLEENTAIGEYECHVSNLAGSAKKSLVLSPVVQTVEATHSSRDTSSFFVTIIAILSVLLVLCCIVGAVHIRVRGIIKKNKSRKLTTQSASTEMATMEEGESPGAVSHTELMNVTRDNDDVFPYDVIQTWTGSNGPYMSLNRGERQGDVTQVTQVRRPDYANISPSNRNDSAANCMYAPLRLTPGSQGGERRPYVNVDTSAM